MIFPRRKETSDKRDRALFELNMGSKRSAVILISYIYKSVKRKRKEAFRRNSLKLLSVFYNWYVVLLIILIGYTNGISVLF